VLCPAPLNLETKGESKEMAKASFQINPADERVKALTGVPSDLTRGGHSILP